MEKEYVLTVRIPVRVMYRIFRYIVNSDGYSKSSKANAVRAFLLATAQPLDNEDLLTVPEMAEFIAEHATTKMILKENRKREVAEITANVHQMLRNIFEE